MNLLGMEVIVDDSLASGVFKFINLDGREDIFTNDGSKVLEGEKRLKSVVLKS